MLFDEELDSSFSSLICQWQIAEERIKGAEQVRRGRGCKFFYI